MGTAVAPGATVAELVFLGVAVLISAYRANFAVGTANGKAARALASKNAAKVRRQANQKSEGDVFEIHT
jgi:hypothetical protein